MIHSSSRETDAPGTTPTPPQLAQLMAERAGPGPFLDPACGEGELLLAALRLRDGDPEFALTSLHGIEIDPHRVRRARARVTAAVRSDHERVAERLERHLVCGDALDPSQAWPEGATVLANPPWVSLAGRNSRRPPPAQEANARELCGRAGGGWPSLHSAFLMRIAEHVKGGSRAYVLLPASVCDQERYAPLRKSVGSLARMAGEPVELGERAFPGVIEPSVLIALQDRSGAPISPLETDIWGLGEERRSWLEAWAGWPRLPPESFADPGLHTGNAARTLLQDSPAPGCAPLREGRDLTNGRLLPPRRWVRTDLRPGDGLRFRLPAPGRLESVPILLRQTADRPLAALHEQPALFRNSLLACTPPEELDPAFVVAVLNGPLATAWHQTRQRDARQRSFPQVKVGHLRTQPFPIQRRAQAPRLHDRIAELARRPGATQDPQLEGLLLQAFELDERGAAALRERLFRGSRLSQTGPDSPPCECPSGRSRSPRPSPRRSSRG